MSEYMVPSLTNGLAVALGLFALWSFVPSMKKLGLGFRAGAAIVAGAVSAVAAFLVTSLIAGGAA
ncbi:hypothetical protein [Devosia nitrariae]|uniref:Uncharacterized protein n=1 Tax=Devosia nitrariae TaxID=2071872 RepID=A0ABQ5WDX7_9HYPH|nr:hypothetical protein [Devosia nitrariae]GLQ57923.1 hypothetical protein GCM10010862_51820 [Devosia nitrariae]